MIEVGDLVRLREKVSGSNHRGVWLVVAFHRAGTTGKFFTLQKGHKQITCLNRHLLKV